MASRPTVAQNAREIQENREAILHIRKVLVGNNGDPGMDEDLRDVKRELELLKIESTKNTNQITEMNNTIALLKGVPSDLKELRKALYAKFELNAMGGEEKDIWRDIKKNLITWSMQGIILAIVFLLISHANELIK